MVKKFVYGTPFETEAVVKEIPSSDLAKPTAVSTNAAFFTSVTAPMIQTT